MTYIRPVIDRKTSKIGSNFWALISTTKFSIIVEQCEVSDNDHDIAIVKNYCYATAVKAS